MARTYDLILMFDVSVPQTERDGLLKSVDATITGSNGTVNATQDWGERKLAYEIDHKERAHYNFLQFAGSTELVASLDHTLSIQDSLVRFRIFETEGDGPPPSPPAAPVSAPTPSYAAPAPSAPTPDAEPVAVEVVEAVEAEVVVTETVEAVETEPAAVEVTEVVEAEPVAAPDEAAETQE